MQRQLEAIIRQQ
jgi:hypothetical protein